MQTGKDEVKNESTLQAYDGRHNALRQMAFIDIEKMKSVKWFFDCGDDDSMSFR